MVESSSHEERMARLRELQSSLINEIRSHLTEEENAQVSDRKIWMRSVEHGPNTLKGHAESVRNALVAADKYADELSDELGISIRDGDEDGK